METQGDLFWEACGKLPFLLKKTTQEEMSLLPLDLITSGSEPEAATPHCQPWEKTSQTQSRHAENRTAERQG